MVAVGEVLSYPAHILRDAAMQARRHCTHHAQIVPTIIAECDSRLVHIRRIEDFALPFTVSALPPPEPLSDEDFERIVAERGLALSAHLDRGLILSNGDGTFRRAERP